MSLNPVTVPKNFTDFMQGRTAGDMQRIEDLLNALQNLKVQITVNGTTQTTNSTIQISGDQALIVVNL